ncbi:ATP-binding protein [Dactylosporangium sp. CA-092794]|uniref:ATP-binding protein n=1 Tax=Dactylosporangium sp. CA-092794 TaxID=3239929 RepID=UPI003D94956D
MPAILRTEWILAVAAVITRLGVLSQLVLAIAQLLPGPGSRVIVGIGAAAVVETCWFAAAVWRARRVAWWASLIDWLALLALLGLPAVSAPASRSPGESPFFNVVTPASITLGLTDWRVMAALGTAMSLAAVNVLPSIVAAHTTYPAWNAVADGLGIVSAVTVAAVVAALARGSARETDRKRAESAARARDLARERERLRQGAMLRRRLVSTLDELARPGVVGDDQIVAQIRKDRRWLSDVIERGAVKTGRAVDQTLSGALCELVVDRAAAGLHVRFDLPEREPELGGAGRDALVGAVREALTNVSKHAATEAAEVCVSVSGSAVVVVVSDHGRGYDPDVVTERAGQRGSLRRRMADAGGRADIQSAPGRGTTITLTLYLTSP